jgi:hypothetical protein
VIRKLLLISCLLVICSGCGFLKKTTPYKMSVKLINESAQAQNDLGGIEKFGWFPKGNISVCNDGGQARLSIKVHGVRQDGLLKTQLIRKDRVWQFTAAFLKLEDGTVIDMLNQAPKNDAGIYIEPDLE